MPLALDSSNNPGGMDFTNVQATSLECKSLISKAFAPHIAVTASQDAEDLCREMGFNSLLDLLRPLGEKIPGRVTIRDSQAASMSFDDYAVRFMSSPKNTTAATLTTPQSPNSLNSPNTTSQSYALYQKSDLENFVAQQISRRSQEKSSPHHDPIYLELFQKLLFALPVSPFETFSHPVAGIIAISSHNHQPIETLSALYNQSNDPSVPEYISREYLRYYVLVHDEQSDLSKSIALFEKMKRHFGLQCHMVRIRRPVDQENETVEYPSSKWGSYTEINAASEQDKLPKNIHTEDLESLKTMVRELVVQSVIPFMERCVTTWNEQIASSRRGIAGRFFSASRKYFSSSSKSSSIFSQSPAFPFSSSQSSSNSSGTGSPVNGNYNTISATYGYLSPEAQLRKLADFAFMLRDYKFAYSTYELLKRDFHNDKAWGYLAASQEMCAISYLLSPEGNSLTVKSRTDVIESMLDLSTYSYISRCSMPTYALRCILLTSELMCTTRSPTAASEGASRWILKALNEKLVGPLGSALLLERISNSYSCHGYISTKNLEATNANGKAQSIDSSLSTVESQAGRRLKNCRDRKAAFWMLLAAREWATTTAMTGDTDRWHESDDCLQLCNAVYGDLEWAQKPDKLLGKLVSAIEAHSESKSEETLTGLESKVESLALADST